MIALLAVVIVHCKTGNASNLILRYRDSTNCSSCSMCTSLTL